MVSVFCLHSITSKQFFNRFPDKQQNLIAVRREPLVQLNKDGRNIGLTGELN